LEGGKDTKPLRPFLRFLLGAAAHLPLSLLHAVGSALGWAIYAASPAYRAHLRGNLAQAGMHDARLRRAAIASAGKMLAELPAVWFRAHEQSAALVRGVVGGEEALAAVRRREPVLFLTPHMGCFEITAQYAAREAPMTVLYRPPKIAALEPLMQEGRGRPGIRLVPADVTGVREVFSALRRGEAVGFLPDQVPGEGEGEWAEFFGRPAYTMTLAARLAEKPGVRCFLAYGRRLPRGRGYEIVLRPLPEKLPGESATRRMNRALEALIRECPEQYLWSYNRYKIPKGAKPR
jgi:KDO2-lipid IV(A) lauroyltransferase